MHDLLGSLKTAKWDTIFHTIGSSHNTLVGLIVDWWISGASNGTHLTLEPALRFVEGRSCGVPGTPDAIIGGGSAHTIRKYCGPSLSTLRS